MEEPTERNIVLDISSLLLRSWVIPGRIPQLSFCHRQLVSTQVTLIQPAIQVRRELTVEIDAVVRSITLPWTVSRMVSLA